MSPAITCTRSGATPKVSAASCASMVWVPWPWSVAPVATTILPDGPMRTLTLSNGPRPVPST